MLKAVSSDTRKQITNATTRQRTVNPYTVLAAKEENIQSGHGSFSITVDQNGPHHYYCMNKSPIMLARIILRSSTDHSRCTCSSHEHGDANVCIPTSTYVISCELRLPQ
jgi:hypothetical protein